MIESVLEIVLSLVLVTLGSAYVVGWRRLRAAGGGANFPLWRLSLYLTGLVSVAAALLSPLDELATELFSAHMVQHMLLTMLAAPLLLLGNPLPVALWGLPRRIRRTVASPLMRGRWLRRALGAATRLSAAGTLYVVVMWIWHLPALYGFALEHAWAHAIEHLALFGTAVLFWWPIIGPAPRLHRPAARGFQILYLIAATGQNIFLGMLLSLPERVLYPQYAQTTARHGWDPLEDQALAGGIMWSMAHAYLLPILLILYSMAREGAREGRSVA